MDQPIVNSKNKRYLGDAVYARTNLLHDLILTTEDGYNATNTIHLEPLVLDALIKYIERQIKRSKITFF